MKNSLRSALFVILTALLYIAVPLHFERAGLYPVTGDEPHYIINGQSIARDHDLKLDNNYAEFGLFPIGPMFPHAYSTDHGWYPFRGIGVPLVIAWPAAAFGPVGARVTLALLMALLMLPVYRVAQRIIADDDWALVATGAFAWALPFVICAGLVFPDTLTGGLSFAAVALLFLRRDARWHDGYRIGFALAVCAICVVYWRHLPVLGVLALAFLAQSLYLHGVRSLATLNLRDLLRNLSFRRDLGVLLALTIGVLATTAYILYYQLTSRNPGFFYLTPPWQWIEPFVGHHLDQDHGILWRNILLWLALPGWYLLWRQQRALLGLIIALYVVLFLPQCMTDMQYGAHGIGGRYSWNFIWLWSFPLFAMVEHMRRQRFSREILGALIGLGFAWQIMLAAQWLNPLNGELLLRSGPALLAMTDNAFGEARWILPSFNFDGLAFQSWLNGWWMLLSVIALAALPLLQRMTHSRTRWALAIVVLIGSISVFGGGFARTFEPTTIVINARDIKSDANLVGGARVRQPGPIGYVGYAVRFKLAPGRYRFQIDYSAPAGGAAWELRRAIRMGASWRIETDLLPATFDTLRDGFESAPIRGHEFNVGPSDTWQVAGVNLWTEGIGTVSLYSIALTRLGPPTGPSRPPQG